ncbi:hypothetical protein BSKO_07575 [Bryopsis sp. KO-2023]|nr:hypothetical protein BSKO_07575 [Bryopsis sp. KO-2023]
MAMVEKSCPMLVHFDRPASATEIKEALEGNDTAAKVLAMKKAIMMLLNQEQLPHQLFITIVRYVLPSEDHTIQRLLLLYLEIIEKTDSGGKLLPEMILICQNLRNNLQHPNEYIRGVTLRFLCRIKEEEIIEPLVSSILSNLEHRHSYVRRNAVLAISAIYKMPKGELLLQDAPETIERLLETEQDLAARRNAFMMLAEHAQDRAVKFLRQHVDEINNWGDLVQMSLLDLIVKVCRSKPTEKGKYLKLILSLLQSRHSAVVYQGAVALVSLSQAPTAIRAAANCFCELLVTHTDNNVKLIVLDRIRELKERHRDVMQELMMDILRALGSPNLDIKKKTLDIALDLITSRNINEVVGLLKKELVKTQDRDMEKGGEYRQLLVQAIHTCAMRFQDVAASVVHILMDFLGDSNTASALDVVFFVREILHTNPKLRESILEQLLESFTQIRSSRVCSCALWILGEFSQSPTEITDGLKVIKEALGPLPLVPPEVSPTEGDDGEENETAGKSSTEASVLPTSSRPVVLADGTYATQTSVAEAVLAADDLSDSMPNVRALLLSGDFFVGSVCAASLTKMALRLRAGGGAAPKVVNKFIAESMLLVANMLRLGTSAIVAHPIDADNSDRMSLCLRVLSGPETEMAKIWLNRCRDAFVSMLSEKQEREAKEAKSLEAQQATQPDETIQFSQLKSKKGISEAMGDGSDLHLAAGGDGSGEDKKLNRILQLTGLSDLVYAEAYVTVHQYDIVMDVTVLNRGREVMQNLCLELATMGDLKLVERPQNHTLAPGDQKVIRANIKVSSTETGVIFGNIIYESGGYSDRNLVVLNDIHIDIMDYINPATCQDVQFRAMWAEFEWENKVAINTNITDANEFLNHIVESTNMKCLTPPSALAGDCGYLAANLYAKSVFEEDALVNLSVEKQPEGKLGGYIRIRSKTQGIALSLGDKITLRQKGG